MMTVIHGLHDSVLPLANTVVAIGVFDGVHRGHQEILRQTVREARSQTLTPVALTFDIHPSELFAPDASPSYIASLRQRAALMDEFGGGIEALVIVKFDRAFASLSPAAFVSDVLEGHLGAKHVLVGADFCYGKSRAGTVTTLLGAGAQNGFAVTVVPPILINGARVSSTQIRGLVAEGDLVQAVGLLGHPFVVEGTVVQGKQLGRTLGYPTANLQPVQLKQQLPATGVYAAWAQMEGGDTYRAAVSVGVNPTTDTDNMTKVEAYLLDFPPALDLYGTSLSLDFRARIRAEERFASLDALIAQISRDVSAVRALLSA